MRARCLLINENISVALLSERLALACGYDDSMVKLIKWAAFNHDIGKILLPQEIINKPGKLLPDELEIIKLHTKYGEIILSSVPGDNGMD